MSVLDLPAPEGVVTPVPANDLRVRVFAADQRFSSPEAAVGDPGGSPDDTGELAARLGTSNRALGTAQGMLKRHLSNAGQGQAGAITARLNGIRSGSWAGAGLMVAAQEATRVNMALIADPLVLLAVGGPNPAIHWSLLPGGPSVTSRAEGLKLIRGLAAGGDLTFEMGKRAFAPLEFDGGAWEYEDEWRLFEDLAVLEEWSGATLPMPDEVTAEEATRAAQAASWVRTEQVDAVIAGAISFATGEVLREVPDELRLSQRFGVSVLGVEVLLGVGAAAVELRRVDREENDGLMYRALPDRTDVPFALSAPAERRLPPRRTQRLRVLPPQEQGEDDRLGTLALTRRAGRPFAEVLASRRLHSRAGSALPGSTAALLDDIRGE